MPPLSRLWLLDCNNASARRKRSYSSLLSRHKLGISVPALMAEAHFRLLWLLDCNDSIAHRICAGMHAHFIFVQQEALFVFLSAVVSLTIDALQQHDHTLGRSRSAHTSASRH